MKIWVLKVNLENLSLKSSFLKSLSCKSSVFCFVFFGQKFENLGYDIIFIIFCQLRGNFQSLGSYFSIFIYLSFTISKMIFIIKYKSFVNTSKSENVSSIPEWILKSLTVDDFENVRFRQGSVRSLVKFSVGNFVT